MEYHISQKWKQREKFTNFFLEHKNWTKSKVFDLKWHKHGIRAKHSTVHNTHNHSQRAGTGAKVRMSMENWNWNHICKIIYGIQGNSLGLHIFWLMHRHTHRTLSFNFLCSLFMFRRKFTWIFLFKSSHNKYRCICIRINTKTTWLPESNDNERFWTLNIWRKQFWNEKWINQTKNQSCFDLSFSFHSDFQGTFSIFTNSRIEEHKIEISFWKLFQTDATHTHLTYFTFQHDFISDSELFYIFIIPIGTVTL